MPLRPESCCPEPSVVSSPTELPSEMASGCITKVPVDVAPAGCSKSSSPTRSAKR